MTTTTLITAQKCPNCDADLTELRRLTRPPTFCLQCRFPIILIAGKYKLTRVLGEGGFGTVYLAEHIRLKRNAERVVKIIKQEVFARDGMEERFTREVQVTSDLSQRNEHIVRIYDDFGDVPMLGNFYVMEYLEGEPLGQYLLDPKNVPPLSWTIDIFSQLCDAMQAAHEDGVIHRDLKPDNILLIKRRKNPYFVKVLDFGIAKPMQDSGRTDINLTQGALGTPMYMPPEQAMNKPVDGRSDIYSMGIILFEMLTGQHPFIPIGREHTLTPIELLTSQMMHAPPSPRELRPDLNIPKAVEEVVIKALAKQPDNRYQSVEEFWDALAKSSPADSQAHVVALTHTEKPPMPTPVSSGPQVGPNAMRTTFAAARDLPDDVAQMSSEKVLSLPPTGEHILSNQEGIPTPAPSYENALAIEPPERKTQSRKKQGSQRWFWAILTLLLVTGGGFFAKGFFSSPKKQPPPQQKRKLLVQAKKPKQEKPPAQSKKPKQGRPHRSAKPVITKQDTNTEKETNDDDDDTSDVLKKNKVQVVRPRLRQRRRRRPHHHHHRRKRHRPHHHHRRRRKRRNPRKVKPAPRRPTAPPNGCAPGQTRLRIRPCSQGGGRIVVTIGNKETKYQARQTICVSQRAGELGVGQPACRECIIQLKTQQSTVYLYLKDQNDKNRKLSLNYCRSK